jgi:hypothetical protein
LSACIADLAPRHPEEDAAADARRGDLDFYFNWGWEESYAYAPGLAQCEISGPARDARPGRRASFDRFMADLPDQTDIVPACGSAIHNYMAAYNRAKAKIRPDSLTMNCGEGRGRIDPSYKPSDVASFRKEAGKD